jgi:hypothetical protein
MVFRNWKLILYYLEILSSLFFWLPFQYPAQQGMEGSPATNSGLGGDNQRPHITLQGSDSNPVRCLDDPSRIMAQGLGNMAEKSGDVVLVLAEKRFTFPNDLHYQKSGH